jgi:tRNA-dihydrouridine synthase B
MKLLFMLAPMEDITDNAFRELCFRHGADLTFTALTRLSGLAARDGNTEKKIELLNGIPTQVQLAAQREGDLKSFLGRFEPAKGFSGINFNIGCPSPQYVRQGLGCAMMKRLSKLYRLVRIVKNHGYPCSVKMRLGMNLFEKQRKLYLNVIKGVDADFFIVHARHGAEHYGAPPDYSVFPDCVATGKDIIANGNIDSAEKVALMRDMGVKGVMIGRAAVRDPGIFGRLKGFEEPGTVALRNEYALLADKYGVVNKYRSNVMKRLGQQNAMEEENAEMG